MTRRCRSKPGLIGNAATKAAVQPTLPAKEADALCGDPG